MHEILNDLNPDGDARLLAALELLELLPTCDERALAAPAREPEVVVRPSAAPGPPLARRHAGRLLTAAGRAARRE